jgi:hypothetical protein
VTPDHEDDDELVEYYLGGGGDEPSDDDDASGSDRHRKGALIGLAVVVVLVAVAITLTSVLVDTSSSPGDPRTAAQRWGDAFVRGDLVAERRLECAAGSKSGDELRLITVDAVRAAAGTAEQVATDRWAVPLQLRDLGGGTEDAVSVTVVRESGRYLVC